MTAVFDDPRSERTNLVGRVHGVRSFVRDGDVRLGGYAVVRPVAIGRRPPRVGGRAGRAPLAVIGDKLLVRFDVRIRDGGRLPIHIRRRHVPLLPETPVADRRLRQ